MRINVIDGFLSPGECIELREDCKTWNTWNPFIGDTYKDITRPAGMFGYLSDEWRERLDEKIIDCAMQMSGTNLHIESAYINAYKTEEFSLPHYDSCNTTALIYLNTDAEIFHGGETIFYENDDAVALVSPKPGRAVFFDGHILHRATPFNKMYQHDLRYSIAYKMLSDEELKIDN